MAAQVGLGLASPGLIGFSSTNRIVQTGQAGGVVTAGALHLCTMCTLPSRKAHGTGIAEVVGLEVRNEGERV